MELFIHIPFQKQTSQNSLWQTVKTDFTESIRFIRKEKPLIGKGLLAVCGINLFLSAMITVALPYLVTEVLPLDAARANWLYGFAEGALAAGGLAGGICAGLFADRLAIHRAGNLIVACALCVFPIGLSLLLFSSGMLNYTVIAVCCFIIMVFSTIFTVQVLSFVQAETPQHLIGKVIAMILTVSMCAQPLGNALYGFLFEISRGAEYAVILFAGTVSLAVAVCTRAIFQNFPA